VTYEKRPISVTEAREFVRGLVSSPVYIDALVDAMSVYSAITATHIKIPAEKSLL